MVNSNPPMWPYMAQAHLSGWRFPDTLRNTMRLRAGRPPETEKEALERRRVLEEQVKASEEYWQRVYPGEYP